MTTLILHTRPDCLAQLAARLMSAGHECHLANTSAQARLMCHSERYSDLYIDRAVLQSGDFDVPRLAISRNPGCRIITLEPADFAVCADPLGEDSPRKPAAPKWRRIGVVLEDQPGSGKARVVRDGGRVNWRVMRAQGRFTPAPRTDAHDIRAADTAPIRCAASAQVPRLTANLPGATQVVHARAETRA